jgi:hypothetical protein
MPACSQVALSLLRLMGKLGSPEMAKRGVIYMVWGDRPQKVLQRSITSLAKIHPELPFKVFELEDRGPVEGLLQKAAMAELSPFEETLFLDADTVVLDRLEFGFEKAVRHGLACCVCESPWARRYWQSIVGDIVEYNTGVLFFSHKAKDLFKAWQELSRSMNTAIMHIFDGKPAVMPHNDQGSFANAVEQTQFNPFVLPLNWNYRAGLQRSFFGPIKIWHDYSDPPTMFYELADYYRDPNSIIQYHSQL